MSRALPVSQRTVPAGAPISVPPGAVSSPFAMARQYAANHFDVDADVPPATPAPAPAPPPVSTTTKEGKELNTRTEPAARKARGPHLATRARETLKSCGPLTVEQFAEGLGIDLAKAQKLASNGIQAGRWKRQTIEGEPKLVLVSKAARVATKAGASGLKRFLTKRGGKRAPTKTAKAKAARTAPTARRARAAHEAPHLPPAIPAAPPQPERAEFSLSNTGQFRIEYAGQEMKLPREVTREMVAYLEKIASAIEG